MGPRVCHHRRTGRATRAGRKAQHPWISSTQRAPASAPAVICSHRLDCLVVQGRTIQRTVPSSGNVQIARMKIGRLTVHRPPASAWLSLERLSSSAA